MIDLADIRIAHGQKPASRVTDQERNMRDLRMGATPHDAKVHSVIHLRGTNPDYTPK